MRLVKAHAFGNDFLLADSGQVPPGTDLATLARLVCARHRGIGADGLIVFDLTESGASMRLLNADGSPSEISGNGVRCLAAWIAASRNLPTGSVVAIETDAGSKQLELLKRSDTEAAFCAAMGQPQQIERLALTVCSQVVSAVTLRVGNPQCVVLGPVTAERLHTIAAGLATHPHFPEGTNVELATVETRDRIRILIWERGVGPTEASGTGACAAAVAAIEFGGASRDVQVVSPGGTQRVEWRPDGLYLTGTASLIADILWGER
ncbi:MAG TPA: diaminopimelate epimerase [Vicinamibacterales bacterium]|jgi:diaminopimelate epimerase|nr:diaminopimelate epimerase [Vicinamibacterales bacterium]